MAGFILSSGLGSGSCGRLVLATGATVMCRSKPIAAVALKIFGRVQGVCYRASAAEKAEELNLVGWVRNNRDGTVEAEAQGTCDNLKLFVEWCKQGPDIAKVTKVEEQWKDIDTLDYSSFRVERTV
ncbi:acylphosphatase [Galdieria sulphuraria]|uniref:acylphosphatase n=1 Tax=Galdieria sulphuraria TaxID=130081 RepID=M2W8V2_GALSU|nr:acylphosphatase [Galdieria sulphuraria]EME32296.1 acylphosphatase [Galdieria sulphuraria]|eukprot:XP_005708816.1 acylphosphatase [Galdieria sulphuraria]